MVCNEHVIIFKDNITVAYSGISRPAPAAGRYKFLVQSRQAQLVTSLGTVPQAGLCWPYRPCWSSFSLQGDL